MGHLNAAYDLKYYKLMRARCSGVEDAEDAGGAAP